MKDADQFSEKETKARMDAALRRALATPPKPHATMKGKKKPSPDSGKAKSGRQNRTK